MYIYFFTVSHYTLQCTWLAFFVSCGQLVRSEDNAERNAKQKFGKLAAIVALLAVIFTCCLFALSGCGETKVEGVELNKNTLELTKGQTEKLTATITPEDAADLTVTWTSSKTDVATVADDGTVTAVATGEATITVTTTDGSFTDTCKVTVTNPATGITLNKTETTITKGQSETLTATVTPDDADDKTVTWASSDETVATVDENGEVTAVKGGTATITASTVNDKKAVCTVTVYAPVTGLEITEPESSRLATGSTLKLATVVTPEDASDKSVTWKSSDETKATVAADGTVTAVAPGEVTITATSNDNDEITDSVTLTIYVAVTGVTLDKEDTVFMTAGDSDVTLVATVAPENATDKSVTWKSSNDEVVTVENGVLTAVAAGDATIKVTTTDGGFTAEVDVHVYAQIDDIQITGTANQIFVGETMQLTAAVTPANANQAVTWESSDSTIATVENGLVTAIKQGDVTITAKAADGTTDTWTIKCATFDNKTGELTLDAGIQNKIVLNNAANSLIMIESEVDGTLYYTLTDVSGRNALMSATDVKAMAIKAGTNFLALEVTSDTQKFVNLLLVETLEGEAQPTDETLASDIVKLEWTEFGTVSSDGIDTWEELKEALGKNEDITLTANIDAKGEEYSPTLSNYTCTFNGNGFAILNLNIVATSAETGLFKSIRTPAVIKDITFINATIDGGTYDQAGLIAGTNGETGENVMTVSGIDVYNLVIKGSNSQYGGLFGRIKGADSILTISDCYIDMTFNQTVIPGVDDGEGNITGGDDSVERIAGVIGYSDWNSKITVENCTVKATFNNCHGNRLGGIISHMSGDTGVLTLKNNDVTAVFNSCTSERVGGLVGSVEQSQAYIEGNTVKTYFVNTTGESNQGGLLGNITSNGKADITNNELYTEWSGAINATRQGGMIGQVANSAGIILNIENCYISVQFVDIASQTMDFFGMITGAAEVAATVNISYVYGETNLVSPYGGSTGAAIGAMQCEHVTMTNCIFVANDDFAGKEGNAGIYGGSYSGGADVLVATNVQVTTAAAGIDATIAGNFANAEVNTEGSANWTFADGELTFEVIEEETTEPDGGEEAAE